MVLYVENVSGILFSLANKRSAKIVAQAGQFVQSSPHVVCLVQRVGVVFIPVLVLEIAFLGGIISRRCGTRYWANRSQQTISMLAKQVSSEALETL